VENPSKVIVSSVPSELNRIAFTGIQAALSPRYPNRCSCSELEGPRSTRAPWVLKFMCALQRQESSQIGFITIGSQIWDASIHILIIQHIYRFTQFHMPRYYNHKRCSPAHLHIHPRKCLTTGAHCYYIRHNL